MTLEIQFMNLNYNPSNFLQLTKTHNNSKIIIKLINKHSSNSTAHGSEPNPVPDVDKRARVVALRSRLTPGPALYQLHPSSKQPCPQG